MSPGIMIIEALHRLVVLAITIIMQVHVHVGTCVSNSEAMVLHTCWSIGMGWGDCEFQGPPMFP